MVKWSSSTRFRRASRLRAGHGAQRTCPPGGTAPARAELGLLSRERTQRGCLPANRSSQENAAPGIRRTWRERHDPFQLAGWGLCAAHVTFRRINGNPATATGPVYIVAGGCCARSAKLCGAKRDRWPKSKALRLAMPVAALLLALFRGNGARRAHRSTEPVTDSLIT